MKRNTILAFCAAALGFALPFLLLPQGAATQAPQEETSAPTEPTTVVEEAAAFDETLMLRIKGENDVFSLSLHDYLVGVLLAEMPASFSEEALKAQAVASRTFVLRQAEAGKHPDADICAFASCCQGWKSPQDYCANGGAESYVDRAADAVIQTDGLVVTYEDKLIDATFFSCSGGRTEAAVAVWGGEIPYLQSVDSPGEEDALRYTETVELKADEFAAAFTAAYPEADLSGGTATWFGDVRYTDGGGIDTMEIGGVTVSGTKLRSIFSLRSTGITLTPQENCIVITTLGNGHRVGLSQYGADAMARGGSNFEEILTHYYQDTAIRRLSQPETP